MKNRVRELRTAAGMTQQQLAEAVHVSARTIISLEKEQYNPSLLLAYRIAVSASGRALGCSGSSRTWRMRQSSFFLQ